MYQTQSGKACQENLKHAPSIIRKVCWCILTARPYITYITIYTKTCETSFKSPITSSSGLLLTVDDAFFLYAACMRSQTSTIDPGNTWAARKLCFLYNHLVFLVFFFLEITLQCWQIISQKHNSNKNDAITVPVKSLDTFSQKCFSWSFRFLHCR